MSSDELQNPLDETPEEAAEAILKGLDYLRREAEIADLADLAREIQGAHARCAHLRNRKDEGDKAAPLQKRTGRPRDPNERRSPA